MAGEKPIVSIVVPFGGYLLGSLVYNWLNQKKELQWRLQVEFKVDAGQVGAITSSDSNAGAR